MAGTMWLSMRRSAALLVAGIALTRAASVSNQKIEPKLDPKSDKKFFKKDYPDDKRPAVNRHYVFDHPYPAVQDTGDYDRDFVKDENADGGRWQAQMDYDILRNKIRHAEKDLIEAKRKMEKETVEWQTSKDKLADSRDAEDAAAKERREAEKASGEAAARVRELEGNNGEVNDAVKKVNGEISDLEECKKQLAEAKARLKELMKEKKEKHSAAKEEKKAAKEAAAAAERESKEGEAKKKKAKEEQDKVKKQELAEEEKIRDNEKALAEDEVEQRTKEEASWKKKLAAEKQQNAEASKSYEQELADVRRTEKQLKAAEENLRKFRRPPHVDNDGGVYNVPDRKSGAAQSHLYMVAMVLMLAVVERIC